MKTEVVKAFKGFKKDWTCQGFQYKIRKEYVHLGKVDPCRTGFHACENPLDVLTYYSLTDSVFAKVELSGEIKRKEDKCCAEKIKVVKEISIFEFINAAVEETLKAATPATAGTSSCAATAGDSSHVEVTGRHCAAAAVGNQSKIKGSDSTPVALCHYVDSKPVKFICGVIGQEGLKADTWYELSDKGRFVEVKS